MKEGELVNELARTLKVSTGVDQVILFGSQAKGETHSGSDIDLAVVLTDGLADNQRLKVEESLRTSLMKKGLEERVDLVIASRHTFQTHPGELFQNIRKEGKLL